MSPYKESHVTSLNRLEQSSVDIKNRLSYPRLKEFEIDTSNLNQFSQITNINQNGPCSQVLLNKNDSRLGSPLKKNAERICKFLSSVKFFIDKYDLIKKEAKEAGTKIETYDNFIRSVLSKLKKEKFEAGQFIYHKGDVGTKMYFVMDGEINMYVPKTFDEQKKQSEELESAMDISKTVPRGDLLMVKLEQNMEVVTCKLIEKNMNT